MKVQFRVILLCFLFVCQSFSALTKEECDQKIALAIDAMNRKEHVKSLEILNEIQKVAKQNLWYQQEFLAVNNIGANYYLMLDYGEALNHYLEAYKIALAHLDKSSEVVVLNNIAILYSKENKFDKAEDYFTKAYEIAKTNKDSAKVSIYAINIAMMDNERKNPEKANRFIKIASDYDSQKRMNSTIKNTFVDYLMLMKKYDEAEKEALQLLPKFDNKEDEDNKIGLLLNLSKIYQQKNNLEKALDYLNLANKINKNIEIKEDVYQQYFDLFKDNQPQIAFLYKDSILQVHDSLNQIKNGMLFENSRIKFELENSQKQLSESQASFRKERIIFYTFIGLSVFIIIIFIWAFRNSKIRQKQQLILEEKAHEINLLELEKEKHEKLLLEQELKEKETRQLFEEEKLKNEIESKNRKLATKALYLSTRNSLIEELVEALSKQIDNPNEQNLRSYIQQLQQHLRQENEYETFFSHFEEVNEKFLNNLKNKHPELTSNDIRFLSYVYMNLSSKEISSLLNITLDACRKRKERISKKMNLPENVDLYTYITSS